jgi:hypothetical protein
MFEVHWSSEAWTELTELLFASDRDSRDRIQRGIQVVEQMLSDDPENCGESRDPNNRIAFIDCFGLYFAVDVETQQVWVTTVWLQRGGHK